MELFVLVGAIVLFWLGLYYGYWRIFFLFWLILIALLFLPPKEIYEYFTVATIILISTLVLLSFRTFFIHGAKTSKQKDSFLIYGFIVKILTWFAFLVWILSMIGIVFYIRYEKAWDRILTLPAMSVIVLAFIVIIVSFLFLVVIIYLNHFVIKWKYKITVNPLKREPDERLRGIRYRRKKEELNFYAHESLYGAVYYRRKWRKTDVDIICDNKVTRFFENFEKKLNDKKTRKALKHKRWNGYHTTILINLLLMPALLSFFCYANPVIRVYLNENILATDYQKTFVRGRCTDIEESSEGNSGYRRRVYKFECELRYAGIENKVHFSESTSAYAHLLRQKVGIYGITLRYQPANPYRYYTELSGNIFMSSILLTGNMGVLVYAIYSLRKKQSKNAAKES